MASGHVNRIKRPDTWLHRPMLQTVKKVLANPEPSTHGTKRTFRDVRSSVAIGGKPDMTRIAQIRSRMPQLWTSIAEMGEHWTKLPMISTLDDICWKWSKRASTASTAELPDRGHPNAKAILDRQCRLPRFTRLPGHSYFWALEKAVSSTSPIGCHVRPSN